MSQLDQGVGRNSSILMRSSPASRLKSPIDSCVGVDHCPRSGSATEVDPDAAAAASSGAIDRRPSRPADPLPGVLSQHLRGRRGRGASAQMSVEPPFPEW